MSAKAVLPEDHPYHRIAKTIRLLSPERATLCETGLATGGLAQDSRAALADNDSLCVREDGGDVEAARALDIHEKGARGRHKGLL